jgi:hypothetical protein
MEILAFSLDFLASGTSPKTSDQSWLWPLIFIFMQPVLDFFMTNGNAQTFYRYFPAARRDRGWGLFVTTVGEARLGPGTVIFPPTGHPPGLRLPSVRRTIVARVSNSVHHGGSWVV